jgi:hypothetical protein
LSHSVRIAVQCAWGKLEAMKTIRECQFSTELDLATLVCHSRAEFSDRSAGDEANMPAVRVAAG